MQTSALFSERLRSHRHRLGLTQSGLAEKAGVADRSIPDYESGKSEPSLESLHKLAAVLGTTVSWLLGETPMESIGAHDSAMPPVWAFLSESTLRAVIADLSADKSESAGVLLDQAVADLRRRRELLAQAAKAKSSSAIDAAAKALLERAADDARNPHPKPKR